MPTPIQAVIFDWGGTLTPWHDIDFDAEARHLARAITTSGLSHDEGAAAMREAVAAVWGRSRDDHRSATVADLFEAAGHSHDPDLLEDYYAFWEPHTHTDPAVGPLFTGLREGGIKVGVLSNTIWSRDYHQGVFTRDGVDHLIDGAVYSSEIAHTKPAPEAFTAAMAAVGVSDPAACVYVGDRLFDDVWGAQNAGLRAIHIPHSTIPAEQLGHSEGAPDAVAHELADVLTIVERWHAG